MTDKQCSSIQKTVLLMNSSGSLTKQKNFQEFVMSVLLLYLVGEEVHLCDGSILIMQTHELHTWRSIPDSWSRIDWILITERENCSLYNKLAIRRGTKFDNEIYHITSCWNSLLFLWCRDVYINSFSMSPLKSPSLEEIKARFDNS